MRKVIALMLVSSFCLFVLFCSQYGKLTAHPYHESDTVNENLEFLHY